MGTVLNIALAGGLFAILAFIHFFVDFICQTHFEAMNKHNNAKIRTRHCIIYAFGFVPIFYLFNFNYIEWLIGLNILFWSHFIEDSYYPVFLWAKYVRKPAEFLLVGKAEDLSSSGYPKNDKEAFLMFVMTPLGKILMIAVDQIIHLAFLFPIVWMALSHIHFKF